MKRLLSWLVNILLLWLLIVVIAVFLLPRFSSWRFDTVLSGSMEPALPIGSVVAIKPVEATDISVGDIIAYNSGETLITHRVLEITNERDDSLFVTKGDANEEADTSLVSASSLVGKVVFDVPYLGYLASFIHSRLGFILTIIVPGLVIIALELRNLWREVIKEKSSEKSRVS